MRLFSNLATVISAPICARGFAYSAIFLISLIFFTQNAYAQSEGQACPAYGITWTLDPAAGEVGAVCFGGDDEPNWRIVVGYADGGTISHKCVTYRHEGRYVGQCKSSHNEVSCGESTMCKRLGGIGTCETVPNCYEDSSGICPPGTAPAANGAGFYGCVGTITPAAPPMCGEHPGVIGKVVGCIEQMVEDASTDYISELQASFSQTIGILLAIYIAWFGARVMFADTRGLMGETIVVALTSIGVVYFTTGTNLQDFIQLFKDTQETLMFLVTDPLQNNDTSANLCADPSYTIWQRMDCTMALFIDPIGVTSLTGAQLASGDIDVLRDPLFTGIILGVAGVFSVPSLGIPLLMLALICMIMLILAFAQAAIVYLTSLLVITFLAVISPIAIASILFRPTRNIFEFWFQMFIGYTILPAIILAYITFSVFALGFAFQRSSTSINVAFGDSNLSVIDTTGLSESYAKFRDSVEYNINPNVSAAAGIEGLLECIETIRAGGVTSGDTCFVTVTPTINADKTGVTLAGKTDEVIDAVFGDTIDRSDPIIAALIDLIRANIDNPPVAIAKDYVDKIKLQIVVGEILINMIVLLIMVLLVVAFMQNVMNFAGQIAGIGSAHAGQAAFMYNRSVGMLTRALERSIGGGR